MPNCRAGISKPCGRACIGITRTCRKDQPVVYGPPRAPRPLPVCNAARSKPCGRACIGLARTCRTNQPPIVAVAAPLPPQPMPPPMPARFRINVINPAQASEAYRLQTEALTYHEYGSAEQKRLLEESARLLFLARGGVLNPNAGWTPMTRAPIPTPDQCCSGGNPTLEGTTARI